MNCPCQSGQTYDACCGRFISHRQLPENARQLMRSRYSAYALNELEYLRDSWHPDHCPPSLEADPGIKWIGLEVIDSAEQADEAWVEFEARFLLAGRVEALHEKSRFVRRDGRWLYCDGDLLDPRFQPWKPGRNESCPCGSGNKFKRCCA